MTRLVFQVTVLPLEAILPVLQYFTILICPVLNIIVLLYITILSCPVLSWLALSYHVQCHAVLQRPALYLTVRKHFTGLSYPVLYFTILK